DDGGWDFDIPVDTTEHSATQSPENTYGVTAFGVLAPYIASHGRDPRLLMGALDTYLGIERRPEIDSGPDFPFLIHLSSATGNTGFRELARARYDAKVAQFGSAQKLGESVRDARGRSGNDGLIPFDLGWYVLAALSLEITFPGHGYFSDAQTYGRL